MKTKSYGQIINTEMSLAPSSSTCNIFFFYCGSNLLIVRGETTVSLSDNNFNLKQQGRELSK